MALDGTLDGPRIPEQNIPIFSNAICWWPCRSCALGSSTAAFAAAGSVAGAYVAALCSLPVLIWNAQHHWITVQHVASDGAIGQRRGGGRSRSDFLLAEGGLLHPVFFAGAAGPLWRCLAGEAGRSKTRSSFFYLAWGDAAYSCFYFLWSFQQPRRTKLDVHRRWCRCFV